MKFISAVFGLIVTLIAVVFAVSNHDPTTVSLWPFDARLEAPLYMLTVGALLLGLALGALIAWIAMLPHRFLARRLKKDMLKMRARLEQAQQSVAPPRTPNEFSLLRSRNKRWKWWGPSP